MVQRGSPSSAPFTTHVLSFLPRCGDDTSNTPLVCEAEFIRSNAAILKRCYSPISLLSLRFSSLSLVERICLRTDKLSIFLEKKSKLYWKCVMFHVSIDRRLIPCYSVLWFIADSERYFASGHQRTGDDPPDPEGEPMSTPAPRRHQVRCPATRRTALCNQVRRLTMAHCAYMLASLHRVGSLLRLGFRRKYLSHLKRFVLAVKEANRDEILGRCDFLLSASCTS